MAKITTRRGDGGRDAAAVSGAGALAQANRFRVAGARTGLLIIHTSGPLSRRQTEALRARGAVVLEYAPPRGYLCYCALADPGILLALAFIEKIERWR